MTNGRSVSGDARRPPGGAARAPGKREPKFLYLTTIGRRTKRPREIEIWFTRSGNRYYLVAETGERAQWVTNLRRDSQVRWRVGRTAFTGRARVVNPVRERTLAKTVRASSTAKYGWGTGLIVELRSGQARRPRG